MQNAPMLRPGCPASPTTHPILLHSWVLLSTSFPQGPPSLLLKVQSAHDLVVPTNHWLHTSHWHLKNIHLSLSPCLALPLQWQETWGTEDYLCDWPQMPPAMTGSICLNLHLSSILSSNTLKLVCASGLNGLCRTGQVSLRTQLKTRASQPWGWGAWDMLQTALVFSEMAKECEPHAAGLSRVSINVTIIWCKNSTN